MVSLPTEVIRTFAASKQSEMERDSLDFKNMSIGSLFMKQFIPTLLGMVSSALFIIVDGIFVGRGIGAHALAAVNIVAPISMIAAGIGLMFGMGGAIVASINLSRGKHKVANLNFTQSVFATSFISILLTVLILLFPYQTATLLGSDAELLEMAVEYLFWFTLCVFPFSLTLALPFFVRLMKPKYAMWCMLLGTLINIVLDYVFIFIFEWGLMGAAVATGVGELVAAVMLFIFFFGKESAVRFEKIKLTANSIRLSLRNIYYMIKLGVSSFLSEITIAIMFIAGNLVFIDYLGADGVAAYSIICYLFPIVFMVFNATVQSVQPIISFNYGYGQIKRSNKAMKLAITVAASIGLGIFMIMLVFTGEIVSLFVPDTTSATWGYAVKGIPVFAIDFVFFAINIVSIGYYMSVEKIQRAMTITIVRGILPVFFFYVLPKFFGIPGIWFAVAAGDIVTSFFILLLEISDKRKKAGQIVTAE